MRNRYQSKARKSRKFEVVGGRELLLQLPMPLVEVWEDLQAEVEQLAGEAGLRILHGILEDEVTQRVGPPLRPRGRCAGGGSRATWCSAGRRFRLLGRGCARAAARKSNWRTTASCNRTGGWAGGPAFGFLLCS